MHIDKMGNMESLITKSIDAHSSNYPLYKLFLFSSLIYDNKKKKNKGYRLEDALILANKNPRVAYTTEEILNRDMQDFLNQLKV